MSNVNLGRLVGGKSCSVPCTIFGNRFQVSSSALANTRANAFALVDTKCAQRLSKYLATPFEKLPKPIWVRGYDGSRVQAIATVLQMHIRVDRRRQYNTPFLIADLGNFDLILGRKWLSFLKLQLDVRNRRIIWPKDLPLTPCFVKEACVTIESLLRPICKPAHQADADRRDAAFEKDAQLDPQRIQILRRPQGQSAKELPSITTVIEDMPLPNPRTPNPQEHGPRRPEKAQRFTPIHTERIDWRDSLRTMERELQIVETVTEPTPVRKRPVTACKELPQVDICAIGAAGFRRNLKGPGAVAFTTSLYEIDQLLEDKLSKTDKELTDEQLLNSKLPARYQEFRDVFSKAISDTLPPHRPNDHKIKLEGRGEAALSYCPLRQQSANELLATKQYLIEHLGKGFVDSSQAPFAALILFVRKPSSGLRFCVDYYKLNAITRKDRYPLPLLEETLAYISKAKVFTKLDIRQAFY
jgi:hypothetical protein